MKVNMTPNPLDVVTIHASQGDTEARQWEFELHNNGELIDTSEITEQMFFKAYKGGTEQLLPENTSTPTTSPFLGDIRYPQGLLSDQEFTYRQSPTEEDGLAKITDIKGNTLVWNQLVPPLSTMSAQNGTLSVADNVATITSSSNSDYLGIATSGSPIVLPKGEHKYLLTAEVKLPKALSSCNLWYGNALSYIRRDIPANTWTKVSAIASYGSPTGQYIQLRGYASFEQGDTMQVRNWNYFDLTAMGLDSLTVEQFTSLFPLSYYSYNQGYLLSFMGNGIKTVGLNQWDEEWEVGAINSTTGENQASNSQIRSKNYIEILPNTTYYFHVGTPGGGVNWQSRFYDADFNYIGTGGTLYYNRAFVTPSNAKYLRFSMQNAYGTVYKNDICINISSSKNGTYEPYTSSTLSLPISTYFPNGMKSAGNVYDELTENKAITRIGSVDLGSLTWSYRESGTSLAPYFYATFAGVKYVNPNFEIANVLCAKYQTVRRSTSTFIDKTICMDGDSTRLTQIQIKDSSYTDATALKNSLSGQYLAYELATESETSFTTASLVTENAEIPLSNDDGVLIGKCTEELSSQPGFIDAKIKLTDGDGTCYSNKIQLHVERKP